MNNFEVIIAGAGPAGSAAALLLAQKGIKTLVIDKAMLPRYKTCGGGVVGRTSQFLPLDYTTIAEHSCYSADIFDIKNNFHFYVKKTRPVILMTMRKDLDWFLLSLAKQNGAAVLDNCELLEVYNRNDYAEIETSKGTLRAKFLIAADGSSGIISKKSGWDNLTVSAPAIEYEVHVKDNVFSRLGKSARFDFGTFPQGYSWVFPKKDHLSIGSAFLMKSTLNLHKITMEYLKLLGIDDPIKVEKHGFFVKVNPRSKKFIRKQIFFTGDSAGFADPLTGEGISYAILSGKLAASAIIESGFNSELAGYFYNRDVQEKILKELKYAKFLWKIVYGFPKLRTELFRFCGQKLSEGVTSVMSGDKTYSELFLNLQSYLKLLRSSFTRKKKSVLADRMIMDA
ncbi:MAG TPA: geranylgeranyl reductase family protein [Ignavibacteriaceae bacterium]|nr:geranylgeranyl reductase family protein [Ignavibacteriaceae bacterium]